MRLNAAVSTHVGRIRENNEDNFYLRGQLRQDLLLQTQTLHQKGNDAQALFAVADGMGGQANGEIASLVTVQNLFPCRIAEVAQGAQRSIQQANDLLCEEIRNSGVHMGSTLAALYADRGQALGCNLGDSRIYLFRDGVLHQLSQDHTQVQQMVRAGLLTPEQARTHPHRHVLTQNVGIFPEDMELEPYFTAPVELKSGDLFLLCTDGLTDMADEAAITSTLAAGGTPEKLTEDLVQLALARGGRDNVTVMLVHVSRGWPFL